MSHATLTQRLAAVDHFTDEVLNAATVVLRYANELGGLSTTLGLFASQSLTLSTKGVVVMGGKGSRERQEHVNCNPDGPSRQMLHFTCSLSCSSSPRGRLKTTVTRGLESLTVQC